jgi:hypothetical protein
MICSTNKRKFVIISQAGILIGRRVTNKSMYRRITNELIKIERTLPAMMSVEDTEPLARNGTKCNKAVIRKQILQISATLEKNRSFCMIKNSYFATLLINRP